MNQFIKLPTGIVINVSRITHTMLDNNPNKGKTFYIYFSSGKFTFATGEVLEETMKMVENAMLGS